jgi:hypothetical protein
VYFGFGLHLFYFRPSSIHQSALLFEAFQQNNKQQAEPENTTALRSDTKKAYGKV